MMNLGKINGEIKFYVDSMLIESLLSEDNLRKTAGAGTDAVMALIDKVKGYVGNHIDPANKAGSLLNILAPGAVLMVFSAMNMTLVGALVGIAMNIFHVDVSGILTSIYNKLKGSLSDDKKMTSSQVDAIVVSSVQEHAPADSEDPLISTNFSFQDIRIIKLALLSYQKDNNITKLAIGRVGKTVSILRLILSWFFKVAIASAGLMVAGDLINKFLGRPNALDGTFKDGKEVNSTPAPQVSSQTKFKVNSSYKEENYNTKDTNWIEKITNNKSSIENMILSFAKDVYSGLNGLDNLIRSTTGFQFLVDKIEWHNSAASGGPVVLIPKAFNSKKKMVDLFIDEVADKTSPVGSKVSPGTKLPSGVTDQPPAPERVRPKGTII